MRSSLKPLLRAVVTTLAAIGLPLGCSESGPVTPGTPDARIGTWLSVSAGTQNSCALAADSVAYCWGQNHHDVRATRTTEVTGQIGDGGTVAGFSLHR